MRTKYALKKTGLPSMWHVVGIADNGEISTSSVGFVSWTDGLKKLSQTVKENVK